MAGYLLLCFLFLIQDRTGAADCDLYCCDQAQQDTCCQRFQVIQDSEVTLSASSSKRYHSSSNAALYGTGEDQNPGWAPRNTADQWIQVDFGSPRQVTGVLLQGGSLKSGDEQWVESFQILFSDDGREFTRTSEIEGNCDRDTVARRCLDSPIIARFFRINPITWNKHIVLRFDLLGCDV